MHNQSASSTRDTWLRYTLGDLGVFRKGRGIRKNEVLAHGIPCVRYGEIYTIHQSTIQQCHSFIDQRTASGSERLAYGDVIFAVSGETSEEIGKCSTFLGNYEAYVGSDTLILSPRGSDPIYLGYALNFGEVLKQKQMLGQGDAVVHLSLANLAKVTISLPPLAEQIAIGQQLFQVDSHLFAIDKLIAKKKDIKQGAMQQLLTGKTRLPGFSGEWNIAKLAEACECLDSRRIPISGDLREVRKGTYPYCGANGVVGFMDDFIFDDDLVLIAEDGGNFDAFATRPIAYRMKGKFWVNNHAHVLKAKSDTDTAFLHYSLEHKDIREFLSGGTRAKLNRGELDKIEISYPSLPEQQAIGEVIEDLDAEIDALVARRDKTTLIKIGMMQELLTGRTRLL